MGSFILAIGCILLFKLCSHWYAYWKVMEACQQSLYEDKATFKVAIYKNFFQLLPIFEEVEISYLTYITRQEDLSDTTKIRLLEDDITELQMLQGRYVLDNKNPSMKTCLNRDNVVDLDIILNELICLKEDLQLAEIFKEQFKNDHL